MTRIWTFIVNVGYSTDYGSGTDSVPKPAFRLQYLPLLFLKVAGSQLCLRTLLQPISLHLLMNIHELASPPMLFTNGNQGCHHAFTVNLTLSRTGKKGHAKIKNKNKKSSRSFSAGAD